MAKNDNGMLARAIKAQTFSQRMDFAEWLSQHIREFYNANEGYPSGAWFAEMIEDWAVEVLEDVDG